MIGVGDYCSWKTNGMDFNYVIIVVCSPCSLSSLSMDKIILSSDAINGLCDGPLIKLSIL